MRRVAATLLLGFVGLLLVAHQSQAIAIDEIDVDDLMVGQEDSKLSPEARARYTLVCGRFRGDEIMFTGGCYLLKPNFLGYLNSIPKEILEFDPEKNVDDLLKAFLPRLFVYFGEAYPQYRANLTEFYRLMDEIAKKLTTGTSNVNMIEVDDAFEKSGLWKAKQELIDEKAAITATTAGLSLEETNAILAKYRCDSDSLFCPYTNDVFGIVDTNNWNTLTITEVLLKGVNNSIKYLNDPFLGLDYQKIYGFLADLDRLGTEQVKVSRVHTILNDTKYWTSLVKVFETENYAPPTEPTTTTKTTRTTTQREKVIPKVAVSIEWYISVPTVVFFLGTIIAIALFFTSKPMVAQNQVNTANQRPVQTQPAQRPAPLQPPQQPKKFHEPDLEMKPRIQSVEKSNATNYRTDMRRTPTLDKFSRPTKEDEDTKF